MSNADYRGFLNADYRGLKARKEVKMKRKIIIIGVVKIIMILLGIVYIFLAFPSRPRFHRADVYDYTIALHLYENGKRIQDNSVMTSDFSVFEVCEQGKLYSNASDSEVRQPTFYRTNESDLITKCGSPSARGRKERWAGGTKEQWEEYRRCLKSYGEKAAYKISVTIPLPESVTEDYCFNVDIKTGKVEQIDCLKDTPKRP